MDTEATPFSVKFVPYVLDNLSRPLVKSVYQKLIFLFPNQNIWAPIWQKGPSGI